jgi:hypothetical protein
LVAVAALRVAAFAVAAVVVAACTATLLATLLAALLATFDVAAPAAFARAASGSGGAACFGPDVRRGRVAAGRSIDTGCFGASDDCAFPRRCIGSGDTSVVALLVDRRPAGADPSTRGLSWWSELMHLTSVGRHSIVLPGRGAGPM